MIGLTLIRNSAVVSHTIARKLKNFDMQWRKKNLLSYHQNMKFKSERKNTIDFSPAYEFHVNSNHVHILGLPRTLNEKLFQNIRLKF